MHRNKPLLATSLTSSFVLSSLLTLAPAQAPGSQLALVQGVGTGQTMLIDKQGKKVHVWPGDFTQAAHLAPDGTLFRTNVTFNVTIGGASGIIQRLAPDGTVLWEYTIDGPNMFLHHDVEPMPNGNVLVIVWDALTDVEAIADGRDPATVAPEWWPDAVLELEPIGTSSANIVWEWHIKDHLIQDFDPTKNNFGVVADHPELLDINFPGVMLTNGDWNHANGIDYDPINDWILFSSREQNEIYLIDHSTTTAEAAGHTGGLRGRGGDILWRWGNPRAYDAGTEADRWLGAQHDPRFIPLGSPGAGNVTVFNNGHMSLPQSAVYELELPLDLAGNVVLDPGTGRYGPVVPVWTYTDPSFFSGIVSSAERLPNGNTLICSGVQRRVFEVSLAGVPVFEHVADFPAIIFQAHSVPTKLWESTQQ